MSEITAPAGWGFLPGAPMLVPARDRLPELPLLERIHPTKRGLVVRDALRQVAAIVRDLRPVDLIEKYGLPQATASRVLSSVRVAAHDGMKKYKQHRSPMTETWAALLAAAPQPADHIADPGKKVSESRDHDGQRVRIVATGPVEGL